MQQKPSTDYRSTIMLIAIGIVALLVASANVIEIPTRHHVIDVSHQKSTN